MLQNKLSGLSVSPEHNLSASPLASYFPNPNSQAFSFKRLLWSAFFVRSIVDLEQIFYKLERDPNGDKSWSVFPAALTPPPTEFWNLGEKRVFLLNSVWQCQSHYYKCIWYIYIIYIYIIYDLYFLFIQQPRFECLWVPSRNRLKSFQTALFCFLPRTCPSHRISLLQ